VALRSASKIALRAILVGCQGEYKGETPFSSETLMFAMRPRDWILKDCDLQRF
jgi:hypothetical protein